MPFNAAHPNNVVEFPSTLFKMSAQTSIGTLASDVILAIFLFWPPNLLNSIWWNKAFGIRRKMWWKNLLPCTLIAINWFILLTFCSVFILCFIVAGVINRGDSFRRKRSRSNSLATSPISPNHSPSHAMPSRSSTGPVESHRVSMLGGPGVGKTALISQFCTSECINAYEDTGERLRVYAIFFLPHFGKICRLD